MSFDGAHVSGLHISLGWVVLGFLRLLTLGPQSPTSVSDLSPYFNGLDGTFVMLNGRTGQYTRYNPERAAQRFPPCSTFKIPNTAILLESGVAPNADYELQYDPSFKQPTQWARDFTLRTAYKLSALWYYQVLARRAGMSIEQRFLHEFAYGNEDTRGGLDEMGNPFWIDGTLRISANEQIDFLRRFNEGQLGLSERTMQLTKDIMIAETTPTWILRAKTGACLPDGESTANWYVGFVEKREGVYYFALEMGDTDFGRAFSERISKAREILADLGVLR
jgi:beta-lactamase class D